MYEDGRGVEQDFVRAYMWLDLGARSGDADSLKSRDLEATLMTPKQIAQAQKMAGECQRRKFKQCD
jgi:hypothetical protein